MFATTRFAFGFVLALTCAPLAHAYGAAPDQSAKTDGAPTVQTAEACLPGISPMTAAALGLPLRVQANIPACATR